MLAQAQQEPLSDKDIMKLTSKEENKNKTHTRATDKSTPAPTAAATDKSPPAPTAATTASPNSSQTGNKNSLTKKGEANTCTLCLEDHDDAPTPAADCGCCMQSSSAAGYFLPGLTSAKNSIVSQSENHHTSPADTSTPALNGLCKSTDKSTPAVNAQITNPTLQK